MTNPGLMDTVSTAPVTPPAPAKAVAALPTLVVGLGYWPKLFEGLAEQAEIMITLIGTLDLTVGPFFVASLIGLSTKAALALQWVITGLAAVSVLVFWRSDRIGFDAKVALLMTAMLLSAPYLWYYEAAMMPAIGLFLVRAGILTTRLPHVALLVLLWIGAGLQSANVFLQIVPDRYLGGVIVTPVLCIAFVLAWVHLLGRRILHLGDLLLGDLMWKSSSSCSLPFLRVCNQFLRVLDTASQNDQCEWRGRIMIALAKGFSVADRSALKLWGTFHSTNINDFESADKYHENHPEVEQSNTGGSNKMNYKLYESFWSLQADFANPNQIQVGAFMKKLKTVFDALESVASIRTDWSATPTCNSVKYLTASSLLPTQLASPEFRSAVVSQFLILSLHLSSESPVLANALTPLLTRAKKLLQSDNPECYHLLCDSVLSHRENAWRRWKKDKCPTAAFAPKQKPKVVAASPKTKGNPMMNGALGDSEAAAENEYESFRSEELLKGSQELKKALPTLEEYLEPYVEALDPESGIEAEYHPGNDPLYAWRAMRLYARHQLPLLKHCRKPTDLERITRIWYSSQGKEIPGDMMSPLPDEEEEESCASKLEEEEADPGDLQDHEEELKTQENDEADEADDRSPIHDENMIDDECDEEAPQAKDEFESPDNNDIANDEPEEAGRQSDTSSKNDITSDAGSFRDNVGTDVMEGESPLESKLVGAADDVVGKQRRNLS